LNTMHRMVYPFLPVISRGMGVEPALLAGAITMRALLGGLAPLLGSIADRSGRKLALLIGVSLFTLGALLAASLPIFAGFVAALFLALLGKYLYDSSMQAYLGDRVPYERRGRVLAVTELGWSLSFILGIPAMGLLIDRLGWQAPFAVLAGLGVLSLLLLFVILPADGSPDGQRHIRIVLSPWDTLRLVASSTPALLGLSVGFLISAANETINLVFGVWMETSFQVKIAALGAAAALFGLAELGAEGSVAAMIDRIGKPRAVGMGILANSLAALALPLLGRTLPGALAGLFLFYFTFEFTLVSIIPLMTELLPGARATLMSANIAALSLGRALGASLGLPLFTLLNGRGANAGMLACAIAATTLNLAALLMLARLRRSMLPAHSERVL
jgi:predicted MFS family arabinose efflux permease